MSASLGHMLKRQKFERGTGGREEGGEAGNRGKGRVGEGRNACAQSSHWLFFLFTPPLFDITYPHL